jgi:hypothetical protein
MSGSVVADFLTHELASLEYPGFAHLQGRARKANPAEFLLTAFRQRNLARSDRCVEEIIF